MAWIYAQVFAILTLIASSPEKSLAWGLDEELYPIGALEALIEVESCGREDARKGKFHGLLQMSPIYLSEVGRAPDDVMHRYGAIAAFFAMQRKYRVRRKGLSELAIPIFHKGGAGVWARWRQYVSAGHSESRALSMLKNPGLEAFLKKYEKARSGNAHWCK